MKRLLLIALVWLLFVACFPSDVEYAEGVVPIEIPARGLTKAHIDSTLAGVGRNLGSGDRLENLTILNGKVILHYYQEYDSKPHAPACIKWENR